MNPFFFELSFFELSFFELSFFGGSLMKKSFLAFLTIS
ncbi:hypothetical protein HPHPA8_1660 [Helicobacter pylori Hp A-8]|nr:hypothetical protein HPHPA8_1660 [Helicobacter pylori Hp A-8]